eukprot:m.889107 g.889107  ORF g.889107 m.889107 type:complete len:549 (+) comp23642_c1_seq1:199-1845(+)
MAEADGHTCASCGKEISYGQDVIKFQTSRLHLDCYRCGGPCQKRISVEQQVFEHKGRPWCQDCYADDVERMCWRCNEKIPLEMNGRINGVTCGNLCFHPQCYCCIQCQAPFALGTQKGERAYEVNGQHYCETHAKAASSTKGKKKAALKKDKKAKKGTKCAHCKKKEPVPEILDSKGKFWHPDCQPCKRCKVSVKDKLYIVEKGVAYCDSCSKIIFVAKCAGCWHRIESPPPGQSVQHVKMAFGTYHMACFVCTDEDCEAPLLVDGQSAAFIHENKPFCKTHYKIRHAAAKKQAAAKAPVTSKSAADQLARIRAATEQGEASQYGGVDIGGSVGGGGDTYDDIDNAGGPKPRPGDSTYASVPEDPVRGIPMDSTYDDVGNAPRGAAREDSDVLYDNNVAVFADAPISPQEYQPRDNGPSMKRGVIRPDDTYEEPSDTNEPLSPEPAYEAPVLSPESTYEEPSPDRAPGNPTSLANGNSGTLPPGAYDQFGNKRAPLSGSSGADTGYDEFKSNNAAREAPGRSRLMSQATSQDIDDEPEGGDLDYDNLK